MRACVCLCVGCHVDPCLTGTSASTSFFLFVCVFPFYFATETYIHTCDVQLLLLTRSKKSPFFFFRRIDGKAYLFPWFCLFLFFLYWNSCVIIATYLGARRMTQHRFSCPLNTIKDKTQNEKPFFFFFDFSVGFDLFSRRDMICYLSCHHFRA